MIETSFSFWNLFWQAHWVVKIVMIGLLFASLWSWSIILMKFYLLKKLNQQGDMLLSYVEEGIPEKHTLPLLKEDPLMDLLMIAAREKKLFKGCVLSEQKNMMLGRLEYLFANSIIQNQEDLSHNMGVLASIGSTAPFVGLFGTVWGIMNSFQAIAISKNTNLSVVAPGIAEALLATAIGLLVAIPAVIAYNRLTLSIKSYTLRIETCAQVLLANFLQSFIVP